MRKAYSLGLTQWHHPKWYAAGQSGRSALTIYTAHFDSVEGNSSFYGLPNEDIIQQWRGIAPQGFRFCFKFPRSISHDAQLRHCDREVTEFIHRVSPLRDKLGTLWLQLPAQFGAAQLPLLAQFLPTLPKGFRYGVEVRNLDFFAKGDAERQFNQLLMQQQINRVIFDTRSLFAHPEDDEDTQDALRKKPQVPTHVIATGQQPFVRFISPLDTSLCLSALTPWVHKFAQWIDEGRHPYLFIHTPNNAEAPELALWFSQTLHELKPEIPPLTLWANQPRQDELF